MAAEMFNPRIGRVHGGAEKGLRRPFLIGLVMAFLTFSAGFSPLAQAQRSLTTSDIARLLHEDCRKIARKALFYVSSRCRFKVEAVDFPQVQQAAGEDAQETDPFDPASTQGLTPPEIKQLGFVGARDNVLLGYPADYNPDLELDVERRAAYLDAKQGLLDNRERGNDEPVYVSPDERLLRVTTSSKGFIRETRFQVLYKLTYIGGKLVSRDVRRVTKIIGHAESAQPIVQ